MTAPTADWGEAYKSGYAEGAAHMRDALVASLAHELETCRHEERAELAGAGEPLRYWTVCRGCGAWQSVALRGAWIRPQLVEELLARVAALRESAPPGGEDVAPVEPLPPGCAWAVLMAGALRRILEARRMELEDLVQDLRRCGWQRDEVLAAAAALAWDGWVHLDDAITLWLELWQGPIGRVTATVAARGSR